MNKQVNYIIYAMLLSLSLPIGYYFIDKIVSAETFSDKQPALIEDKTKLPEPVMSKSAALGKILFNSKCAACHQIFKDATGPGILGFEERGPWKDRNKLYEWIRNPAEFMKNDPYTASLKEKYGSMMQSFPDITNEEIDAIVDYINYIVKLKTYPIASK